MCAALQPREKIQQLVGLFYDDEQAFAGTSFLTLGKTEPDVITPSDLLAVTLMGELYPPKAVRGLLSAGPLREKVSRLLSEIPADLEIWEASAEELHSEDAAPVRLWRELDAFPYVGSTKVSKLLARKRPRLIPIYDRWIEKKVAPISDYWRVYYEFLSDSSARRKVDELRPDRMTAKELPTLRVLDTAVWMRYSTGRSASSARQRVGL